MESKSSVTHGHLCVCRLLAAAVGLPPSAVGYGLCSRVLQRRWIVECDHGMCNKPVTHDTSGKWHDVGPIDPVIKAVLVHEE